MGQIRLTVCGSRVSVGPGDPCVAGEGNSTCRALRFGPDWDGLAKTAQFWDAHGQNPVTCLIGEDMGEQEEGGRVYRLPIPPEPLAQAGTCTLVLEGAKDAVRMRTLPVELEVQDAPWSVQAQPPTDPTPTLAQQLQLEVDGLRQYVDESVPVRGVDYWTAEDVAQIVTAWTGIPVRKLAEEAGERLSQLEEKVNRHNNLIERTYKLEGQMEECRHDIKDLKAYCVPSR